MYEKLSQIDVAIIGFVLEFQEPYILKRETVLRLRREFLRVVKQAETSDRGVTDSLRHMLDPVMTTDYYPGKLFQKPSPPFAIQPPAASEVQLDAGDVFVLNVHFVGNLSRHIFLFSRLLKLLGPYGIYRGEGRFDLVDLYGYDQSGQRQRLPIPDRADSSPSVPRIDLAWRARDVFRYDRNPVLTFVTPARLLSEGKPLFRPAFPDVFPFVLRRVTSMAYVWGGVELTDDPRYLTETALDTRILSSELDWQDWRVLDAGRGKQDLGGVVGRIVFDATPHEDVMALLVMGELLNIGKSAAYGCGHYTIRLHA